MSIAFTFANGESLSDSDRIANGKPFGFTQPIADGDSFTVSFTFSFALTNEHTITDNYWTGE